MRAHLDKSVLWRGVRYPKGDCEIPEDLAAALGLTAEPEPKTATVADLPQPSELDQVDAIPNTGISPKPSQGKKRSNQRR